MVLREHFNKYPSGQTTARGHYSILHMRGCNCYEHHVINIPPLHWASHSSYWQFWQTSQQGCDQDHYPVLTQTHHAVSGKSEGSWDWIQRRLTSSAWFELWCWFSLQGLAGKLTVLHHSARVVAHALKRKGMHVVMFASTGEQGCVDPALTNESSVKPVVKPRNRRRFCRERELHLP